LFRCAVSIGGYSDLALQPPGAMPMMGFGPPPANLDKLRAEAPHAHAADFKVPVLLVHGERDTVVTVEQSKAMDATLTLAHKPHQLLLLPGADHALSMEDDRAKMFTALEAFLATNLH
jgi:dipeptidyl aminopeptidase/acylaminoacyl peptidase